MGAGTSLPPCGSSSGRLSSRSSGRRASTSASESRVLCGSPLVVLDVGGRRACAFFSFARCFSIYSKGAEGAAGLLLALGRCQLLQELGMKVCSQIPAAAWQLLATARWEQLRKADFSRCFDEDSEGGEGAAVLLSALARCRQLQELGMYGCDQIPAAAWQQLEGATWSKLTKVNFQGCFDKESKGAGGAAGLLAALARCTELQELGMYDCSQIPAAAWQQLEGAHWPKLTKANFYRCFGENSKGADGAAGLLTALARCAELKDASSLSLQRSMAVTIFMTTAHAKGIVLLVTFSWTDLPGVCALRRANCRTPDMDSGHKVAREIQAWHSASLGPARRKPERAPQQETEIGGPFWPRTGAKHSRASAVMRSWGSCTGHEVPAFMHSRLEGESCSFRF
ncbi:unnamed protein product [Symbiodinium necroappetens]|uniref:Uncharacterized protein n=1 Tax=Symbiodinium necroappetens TaxID=1628268 RepID=A0A812T248_9DINO|nr:unnamed protein product [Symbiodinium necroappetens]